MVDVAEAFFRSSFKGFPVVRVSDGNQGLRPLSQVLVAKVHAAIFSDNILRLEACSDDAGPGSQVGHDFTAPLAGAGRHRDERSAAFGERGAIHEVVLAANAREYHVPDAVGANLAGEIARR